MKALAVYKLVQFSLFVYSFQRISGVSSSGTEFQDVDDEKIHLRLLTDEEVAKLHGHGMPMSQAAHVFNRKLAQAKKMFREQNNLTGSPNQGLALQFDGRQKASPRHSAKICKRSDCGNLFNQILEKTMPMVAIQLCVQLDVNLDFLLPGLSISFGLLGSLSRSYDNGCWALQFEASIGIGWGFQVLGFSLGIGGVFAGTVDLIEVPIASAASEIGSALDVKLGEVYAPDGASLTQCHTQNPWMVVQTWIEEQCRRHLHTSSVHEKTKEVQQKTLEAEREAIKMYKDMVTSEHEVLDGGTSLHWPKISLPAVALFRALGEFLKRVPAYADQIMTQLVDNTKGNMFGVKTAAASRYEKATGRFWARWPSSADLDEWSSDGSSSDEEDDDGLGQEPIVGIDVAGKGNDQRVFNFVKVLRRSHHNITFEFWKEIAISASNFFIRIIGDVVALFNMAFVGTPRWDGNCDSLRPSFIVGKWHKEWDDHPWASKHRWKSKRRRFASRTKDSMGNPYDRVLWTLPKWRLTDTDSRQASTIYPRLWCCLVDQTQVDPPKKPEKDENDIHDLELFVPQACETVTTRIRKLADDNRIQWDGRVYAVFRPDTTDGILVNQNLEPVAHDEVENADAAPDDVILKFARERGYLVVIKDVYSHLECERVLVPGPFVRIFSTFVKFVQHRKASIELTLDKMNACLNEQLWNENKRSRIKKVLCRTSGRRLQYVSDKARYILRMVRKTVIALGAEDPRVAVFKFQEGGLELDAEEIAALVNANAKFAPAVQELAHDFMHGFSLMNGNKRYPKFKMSPYSFKLTGAFWLNAPNVIDKLLTISNASSRVAKIPRKWLRPPVKYMYSLKLTAQSLTPMQATFCTPNTAFLLISPLQASYSRKTWSSALVKETCMVGRTRVGDFFVMVSRCTGADYTDWRIKFFGVIIKGNIFGPDRSGMLGNLMTPGTSNLGSLKAGVIASGVLLGGLSSYKLVNKFKPYVHKHPAFTTLIMLAANSGPLLGASVGASVVSEATFQDICKTVLRYLSEHGVVKTPSENEPSSLSPVKIDMALVLHTALVFREQQVEYKIVPPGYTPGKKTKLLSIMSVVGESWNRFDMVMPIPSVGTFRAHAQLDIRLDLTKFAEYRINVALWEENQKRVKVCYWCLSQEYGFCDWRIALGLPLWNHELDKCVIHSREEIRGCTGAKTDEEHAKSSRSDGTYGLPGSGIYYSPQYGPRICGRMDFPRSNSDPIANEMIRLFLKQLHERSGKSPTKTDGSKTWGNWSAQLPDASARNTRAVTTKTVIFMGIATAGAGSMVALFMVSFKLCFRCRRRLKENARRASWKNLDPAYPSSWGIELQDHACESDDEPSMEASFVNACAVHEQVCDARPRRLTLWQRIGRQFGSFANADDDASGDGSRATPCKSSTSSVRRHQGSISSVSQQNSDGRIAVVHDVRARSAASQISETTSQVPVPVPCAPSAPNVLHVPHVGFSSSELGRLGDQRRPAWLPPRSRSLYAPQIRETTEEDLQYTGRRCVSLQERQLHHQSSLLAERGIRSFAHSDSARNAFDQQSLAFEIGSQPQ